MMLKLAFCIIFIALLDISAAKSAKKGVCIPPGTNFHCGDLAAFTNARLVRKNKNCHLVTILISAGGTTGMWLQTMKWSQWRITAPVTLGPVAPLPRGRPSSPWCGAMMRQTGPGMMTSLTLWRTSMTSSWDSMNPTTRTSLTSHQRRLLLLGLNCKPSTQTRYHRIEKFSQFSRLGNLKLSFF